MKRKSEPGRSSTQPSVGKLMEKSIKTQGIIYLESPGQANKKSAVIQIKPQNKLMYHCYKRFKTFSYSFDHIYQQNEYSEFYADNFNQFNAIQALQSNLNYMMFCSGVSTKSQKQIPTIQILFYEQLSAIYERLIKNKQYSWKFNVLGIAQDAIYDLVTQKKINDIRQIINNKIPHLSDIVLPECRQVSPETNYQIIELIKQTLGKRIRITYKCYYAIFGQLILNQSGEKNLILLIDSTKDRTIEDKNWDNSCCLVLNKCILGLQNKMQKLGKQSYSPFRDSKITRIMKPFLTFDSRIDAVGFINYDQEQMLLSTLSLIKNLSRLRIPITKKNKFDKIEEQEQSDPKNLFTQQNPEVIPLKPTIKTIDRSQSFSKSNKANKNKLSEDDLIAKIRNNTQNQIQNIKTINSIRLRLKLILKKKETELFSLQNNEQKQLNELAQYQQLQFLKKKEQEAIKQSQSLEQSRIQYINKSASKVEKLKMLRQYYSINLANQKTQIQQFIKNKSVLDKFYNQKISQINQTLKKSPRELLQQSFAGKEIKPQKLKDKLHASPNFIYRQKLPVILSKRTKRASYIKQKIKKGRVDYYEFLDKNVQQYKSYSVPIKKQ